MKRKDISRLKEQLTAAGNYPGVKFRYAYSKNMRRIDTEMAALEDTARDSLKPSPEFIAFQENVEAIKKTHGEKDPITGAPVLKQDAQGNTHYVMTDMAAFTADVLKFQGENKAVLDARDAQMAAYNAFMEEELDILFHKIPDADVPEGLTAAEYSGIAFMIADDEDLDRPRGTLTVMK